MTVKMFVRNTKTLATREERELRIGEYNEFYLPSVRPGSEAWVIITDDNGDETRLHLKH